MLGLQAGGQRADGPTPAGAPANRERAGATQKECLLLLAMSEGAPAVGQDRGQDTVAIWPRTHSPWAQDFQHRGS